MLLKRDRGAADIGVGFDQPDTTRVTVCPAMQQQTVPGEAVIIICLQTIRKTGSIFPSQRCAIDVIAYAVDLFSQFIRVGRDQFKKFLIGCDEIYFVHRM